MKMNHSKYDTVVVGAGPAGLIAAHRVAKNGSDVLILEEHHQIGEPDHCAGLLSTSGLVSLGLRPPDDVIQNHVVGARIYAPSGHHILVERGQREALVLDRRRFDQWLSNRATDAGATIMTNTRVKYLRKEDGRVMGVQTGGDTPQAFLSSVVINAEGSRGQISSQAGLPTVTRRSKYPAFQYEVKGVDLDENLVEMYYGRSFAPGFFAWLIPIGENRARVGLAARNHSITRLNAAMRHHPVLSERLKHASIERRFGGIVLVGLPIKQTVTDGLLVVGDAAGIVKPTTGGGVILGGMAAEIAGRVVSKVLSNGDSSGASLREYERSWRALLMKDLRVMYWTQKLLSTLTDKGLDSLIKDAGELKLIETVRREGDMDIQSKVILRLLSRPSTLLAGLKAARYINPFL
ncbi:MAG: NAD(P)/FAD-dependent oxidoreductase [Candidatus Thorarchaeota archaeon]